MMRNSWKKCFCIMAIALAMASLVFAENTIAATIQGIKFNDLNGNAIFDTDEPILANHNVLVRNNETGIVTTVKTGADGKYSVANLAAGTYMVWSAVPTGWSQTAPVPGSGLVTYPVKLDSNTATLTVNFGITDKNPPPPVSDACEKAPTVKSVASGNWNDPNIWDTGKVPSRGDWVLVDGNEITVTDVVDLGDGGLCNRGTLQSADNNYGSPATKVEIHASAVHNSGNIIGKDGKNSVCEPIYSQVRTCRRILFFKTCSTSNQITGWNIQHGTSGSSVEVWATLFMNDAAGTIKTGNGGNDIQSCGDQIPSNGGDGGRAEVFSVTAVNDGGIIQTGNGGNAQSLHAGSAGGNGGDIRFIANVFDPDNQSTNNGFLISGQGGSSTSQPGMAQAGRGGDFDIYLTSVGGTMQGAPGGTFWWDPAKLKADKTLRISGFDAVNIYTDEGGTIDLTQLSEGAVSAAKTITIGTKSLNGQGGTVDLRGLSGKVFKAGEKVEIFADQILTDSGVTLQDLADAPVVAVSPGTIIGRVTLSVDRQITGKPGTVVSVPVKLINGSPKKDTYSLGVKDSAGWNIALPASITTDALQTAKLDMNVTFPEAASADNDIITITAVSQADPNVTASVEVMAVVQQNDTDGDGIPDNWESSYQLNPLVNDASEDQDGDGYSNLDEYRSGTNPNDPDSKPADISVTSDDAVTISGSGGYKMFVVPNTDPNAVEVPLEITPGPDGSYMGDSGKSSVIVVPDTTATKENFTITTGKNLTGTGEETSVDVTPEGDGSYTFKSPDSPSTALAFKNDGSYTITDAEFPTTLITGTQDGNPIVTDAEFPEMSATLNQDGSYGISDNQFSGMTYTVNTDKTYTVTDIASPGTKAVVNQDGSFTITDMIFPEMTVTYHPDNGSYTVTHSEYPNAKVNFNADGTYTITDQDGNCYDARVAKRGFSLKKLIHEAARVVSQVSGFVQKAANFVNAVATKAQTFWNKVSPFVVKTAGIVSKIAKGVSFVAKIGASVFPPLCPIFCAISGFADGVAKVADGVATFANKVSNVLNKVVTYSAKVSDIAGKVKSVADNVFSRTRKHNLMRSRSLRDSGSQNCQIMILYTASGTITDRSGNPMSGVSVKIEDITTTTDNNGHWQIFGLTEGDYTVSFTKDGYTFNAAQITAKDDQNPAPLITKPYSDPTGIFTVDDTGIVKIDWLYDGGKYQGEFGIFSLSGMENLTPGSSEFIAEAVKRVLSNSEQGYLVFSDLSEGARFSGILGSEIRDWNSGPYKGLKSLTMNPGDQFATILVPNSTFTSLSRNPATTDTDKRPLFSLVSDNPGYGTHIGQMADINGMGKAFAYEDKDAAASDWDYNDLIVQITGAESSLPTLDSLVGKGETRSKREKRDNAFTDWRVGSELGKLIMAHIGMQTPTDDTLSVTVTLKAEQGSLLIYDSQNNVIGKDGGTLIGADIEMKADGSQTVSLGSLNSGDYRIVIRSADAGTGTLEVKLYEGNSEISSQTFTFDTASHRTMMTVIPADSLSPDQVISLETPKVPVSDGGRILYYDFDGDGKIDDADIAKVKKLWNAQKGGESYDPFYDFDGDGRITVSDIMKVSSQTPAVSPPAKIFGN